MIQNQKNIMVICEREPEYSNGSGDQKILHSTYYNMKNIKYFIINKYINLLEIKKNIYHIRHKFSNFLSHMKMNQRRFILSEKIFKKILTPIKEELKKYEIDIIIFEQTGILMWSWSTKFLDDYLCIIRVHDSKYQNLSYDIKQRKNYLSKTALFASKFFQGIYEKKYVFNWHQIQFLSFKEFKFYSKKNSKVAHKLYHTPVSIQLKKNYYLLKKIKNIDIVFFGTMTWKPNSDSVKWFCEQVFENIVSEIPDINVYFIGKGAKQKLRISNKSIKIIDYVENIEKYLLDSKIIINPSVSGGGVKVKVMHAASLGIPVISTITGLSGFNNDILDVIPSSDNPIDFSRNIINLLESEDLRYSYSQDIFKYAFNNFNIQKNQKIWRRNIDELQSKNILSR